MKNYKFHQWQKTWKQHVYVVIEYQPRGRRALEYLKNNYCRETWSWADKNKGK